MSIDILDDNEMDAYISELVEARRAFTLAIAAIEDKAKAHRVITTYNRFKGVLQKNVKSETNTQL